MPLINDVSVSKVRKLKGEYPVSLMRATWVGIYIAGQSAQVAFSTNVYLCVTPGCSFEALDFLHYASDLPTYALFISFAFTGFGIRLKFETRSNIEYPVYVGWNLWEREFDFNLDHLPSQSSGKLSMALGLSYNKYLFIYYNGYIGYTHGIPDKMTTPRLLPQLLL